MLRHQLQVFAWIPLREAPVQSAVGSSATVRQNIGVMPKKPQFRYGVPVVAEHVTQPLDTAAKWLKLVHDDDPGLRADHLFDVTLSSVMPGNSTLPSACIYRRRVANCKVFGRRKPARAVLANGQGVKTH